MRPAAKPRPRRTGHARPGVTLLEVVLGVVLIGMVVGTLGATVGSIGGSFQRQRDRLGAAELASRLLIMRVDDENALPGQNEALGYGEREFRWSIEERPTLFTLSDPARAAQETGDRTGGVDMSRRIKAVTVTVWLAEDSGGAYTFTPDVPHASLTRLVDPIAFMTWDSAERKFDTQQGMETFLQDFMEMTSSPMNRPQGGGRPGAQPGFGNGRREGGG